MHDVDLLQIIAVKAGPQAPLARVLMVLEQFMLPEDARATVMRWIVEQRATLADPTPSGHFALIMDSGDGAVDPVS
ncbi:MAG: hypothetical protein H0W72_04970 [Planctomycetes bacterium]|nr:hypothetical protein [Planctomycetota bacterium]